MVALIILKVNFRHVSSGYYVWIHMQCSLSTRYYISKHLCWYFCWGNSCAKSSLDSCGLLKWRWILCSRCLFWPLYSKFPPISNLSVMLTSQPVVSPPVAPDRALVVRCDRDVPGLHCVPGWFLPALCGPLHTAVVPQVLSLAGRGQSWLCEWLHSHVGESCLCWGVEYLSDPLCVNSYSRWRGVPISPGCSTSGCSVSWSLKLVIVKLAKSFMHRHEAKVSSACCFLRIKLWNFLF